jgi:hypothetical protein
MSSGTIWVSDSISITFWILLLNPTEMNSPFSQTS